MRPDSRYVFEGRDGGPLNVGHLPAQLRAHLKEAGIDRPELFESTKTRRNIVAHDLRAVFVQTSIARGKSEAWIMRRTDHMSSDVLSRYRRAAENLAEGEGAALRPLDEAIPEFAPHVEGARRDGATTRANRPSEHADEEHTDEEHTDEEHADEADERASAETAEELSQGCLSDPPACVSESADDDDRLRNRVPKEGLETSRPFGPRILNPEDSAESDPHPAERDADRRQSSPVMDNAAAFDVARAVGLARALAALVDGGATTLARPIAHELLALLEGAQAPGADVLSLDAARSRRPSR